MIQNETEAFRIRWNISSKNRDKALLAVESKCQASLVEHCRVVHFTSLANNICDNLSLMAYCIAQELSR